jgi:serine/threonine-protein kinase
MSAANEVLLATTRGPHGFVRPVVVKRVRDPDPHDPAASNALVREALAYSRLNHPSVVQLYEVIEDDDRLALILEYVPGVALSRLRTLMQRRGEALDDACALHIMASVFAALAAAHEARDPWTGEFVPVVHRDVNPNNVLVSWDGVVKLTDFGIARVTGVASDTRVGLLKGTYGYMAPEQVLGDEITPRTDVYCACLMLRELLLGRPSFTRRGRHELELMQEMAEPCLEPVERLRAGIPPVIAGALRIGLEANPDARAISAAEMRDVLSVHVRHEGRARLAAALAAIRPGGDDGPHEQSATTCQLDTLPGDVSVSSLDSRVRERAPTLVEGGRLESMDTQPEIVDPPTPSIQRDTPQAMVHPIVPDLPSAPASPASRHVRVLLLAACFVATLGGSVALATWSGRATAALAAAAHRGRGHAASIRPVASTMDRSLAAPAPSGSSSGELVTPALADSHRVFVDGRVLGVSGDRIRVPCGPHVVQIGSRGHPQSLVVPCGGQQVAQAQW